MKKRKGLNEGRTYRTLQSLVISTILYPLKYSNENAEVIFKNGTANKSVTERKMQNTELGKIRVHARV